MTTAALACLANAAEINAAFWHLDALSDCDLTLHGFFRSSHGAPNQQHGA